MALGSFRTKQITIVNFLLWIPPVLCYGYHIRQVGYFPTGSSVEVTWRMGHLHMLPKLPMIPCYHLVITTQNQNLSIIKWVAATLHLQWNNWYYFKHMYPLGVYRPSKFHDETRCNSRKWTFQELYKTVDDILDNSRPRLQFSCWTSADNM